MKNINDNCTRQAVLCGLVSGLVAKDFFFHFDYSFDYFLTIKLRPGRSYLVSFDYLTEQNVSESIFKMKSGADANGCNVIV